MAVTAQKQLNIAHARDLVKKAATKLTDTPYSSEGKMMTQYNLVVLPECFNSPYGTQYFSEYAEQIPGETSQMLSQAAKEGNVFLVGGSIPERRGDKLYNTSVVFNPQGDMVLKYSKMHLFDIDIPGKIRFQESEVLTAGDSLGMFELSSNVKVGVGICYDIRFAELSMLLTRQGCDLLVFPGAFNMTTGPAHWELLQRGRAIDNEVFVATCSPARVTQATYIAWGHSTIVNPYGEVIAKTEEAEDIIYAELDLEHMKQVRQQIPIHHQRREDVYKLSTPQ